MYAPSTASGAQWMTRITCLHASGYLRRRVPLWSTEPIVGGRRMPMVRMRAPMVRVKGTDNAVKGTDNASTGTNHADKGTDGAS
jgi:hypothetical protein